MVDPALPRVGQARESRRVAEVALWPLSSASPAVRRRVERRPMCIRIAIALWRSLPVNAFLPAEHSKTHGIPEGRSSGSATFPYSALACNDLTEQGRRSG